jgi:hypothetical protein
MNDFALWHVRLRPTCNIDRLVQAGKCLLYNANQYSLMLAVIVEKRTPKND